MRERKPERIISKPTLAVIKDVLADICTHSSMQNLFEQYDFEKSPTVTFSNKVERAGAFLDHQNWASPEAVRRLLALLAHRFVEIASFRSDSLQSSESCQRVLRILAERENFEWDGQRFVNRESAALIHAVEKSAEFDIETLKRELVRVIGSVETDPDDAITAAKSLVEATCRAILKDFGDDPPSGTELGPLTKQTLKHLNLLPDQIHDASKGAVAAKKVLHSLGTAIQGLGELRNLYGDAHGRKPGSTGLDPRHARLAATFAGGLTTFMLETHRSRKGAG